MRCSCPAPLKIQQRFSSILVLLSGGCILEFSLFRKRAEDSSNEGAKG